MPVEPTPQSPASTHLATEKGEQPLVEVINGPFAGFTGTLTSRVGDQVRVRLTLFGRETPVDLNIEQVRGVGPTDPEAPTTATVREQIIAEYELLVETDEFTFFLERVDEPETDLAGEWDAYQAHRDQTRARAEQLKRVALDRYERELAALSADKAKDIIDGEPEFWAPGSVAVRDQRDRFPEPQRPTAEERLLAAIFGPDESETPDEGEERAEPAPSPRKQARNRIERARRAADERDYERWHANVPSKERHRYPSRGNPTRYAYAYARAPRLDVSLPPERSVELAIRSTIEVGDGPIPPEALDAVDGLCLELYRPTDLTPLGQLRNLRWLSVRCRVSIDLAALASSVHQARALRDLTIEAPVEDITPLAQLTQLRRLSLDHTQVTDVSPLAGLTALSDLSICDGPLADLTPLSGLSLGRLFVYRTQVNDLSPLAGMATLHVLGVADCPIRDLAVVTTLPALRHVNLHRTSISDLGDLPDRAPGVTFEGLDDPNPDLNATATATPAKEDTGPPTAPIPDNRAAELLAEFHGVGDDYRRQGQLNRTMLAGRRLDLVQALIGENGEFSDRHPVVVGLLLASDIGSVPFPPNPWTIPTDAGLTDALTHVWSPIADLAPRFVETIHQRTLALALLTMDNGSVALGYLTWHRYDDGSGHLIEPPTSLDDFADPAKDYHLRTLIGSAPHIADPTTVVPVLAGPIPQPVRDFWAIHHKLQSDFMGNAVSGKLDGNMLDFFSDDGWGTVTERLGGLPPDRFVYSAGHENYVLYLFDLDVLDKEGNPTVAHWAYKDRKLGGHKQYWDWLDSTGVELLFDD